MAGQPHYMRIPSVEIQFGGKARHLIFDYDALAELQDLSGTYHSSTASLKVLRDMLWAGLRAETLDSRGRDTTELLDKNGNIIRLGTLSIRDVSDLLTAIKDDPTELKALESALERARDIAEPVITDPPKAATPNL